MPIEISPALGWARCARINNSEAEVLVTVDVGPRILSYKMRDGENVLQVIEAEAGKSGEATFQPRGGHRLWISPETDHSYAPDNAPVNFEARGCHAACFGNPAAAPAHIRKELVVSLATKNCAVTIAHQLTNEGPRPVTIASWALTIMAPGGYEVIPQPPLGEHGTEFLPNRVIVPWTYTDFSDGRWKFGQRFFILTPGNGAPPTKLGLAHRPGWVAWIRETTLFLKVFEFEEHAPYPDFGCNFETFSKSDFLELESLSPLKTLQPGESVGHTETWHLFTGASPPDPHDENALARWLAPFLSAAGIV